MQDGLTLLQLQKLQRKVNGKGAICFSKRKVFWACNDVLAYALQILD
jgi:hypothetical protein